MRAAIFIALVSAALMSASVAWAEDVRDERLLALIEQLRQNDRWKERVEAAMLLGRSNDIRARKPLLRALEDPHYAVRSAALRALAHGGDVRSIPAILDRLADEEPFVRNEAERALDRFDLPTSSPYLIRALGRHASPIVRLGAATRISESRDPVVLDALLDATGDVSEVSRFAISTIRSLPEPDAIALLLRGLSHGDYLVEIACIRALADMDVREGAEPAVQLLDAKVPEVTIAARKALEALGKHLDRQKYLVMARRSKNAFERARAVKVLGYVGGEEASTVIVNALDHPDVLVRGAAVGALENIRDPRAIAKLREMKKLEENARIIVLIRKTLTALEKARPEEEPKMTSVER